jgi:hypothetical protein
MKKERQARRVKSDFQALLITDDKCEYSGSIENISKIGLFISCKHQLTESAIGSVGALYLLPKNSFLKKKVRIVRLLIDGIGLEPLSLT